MSDGVPNLRPTAFQAWLPLVAQLAAAGAVLWGFAWQASRYPTREEFRQMGDSVAGLKTEQAVMTVRVGGIERQGDRIEKKVEEIADHQGRKNSGR